MRETLTNTGVIKIGGTHTWSPELMGKPVPDKIWSIENADVIKNDEKFTIVNEDYKATLTIKNAVRKVQLNIFCNVPEPVPYHI